MNDAELSSAKPDKESASATTRIAMLAVLAFAFLSWLWLWWSSAGIAERFSTATGTLLEVSIGRVVDVSLPTRRKPMPQYEFWLPRIERVLKEHADDAELHAAAALLMDKPSDHVMTLVATEAMSSQDSGQITTGAFQPTIFASARDLFDSFDQVATPKAMAFIQQAQDIAPDDPDWLRMRAAMMTRPILYGEASTDRTGNPDALLKAASQIDGDNAVYQLLHAARLIEAAIGYDEQTLEMIFTNLEKAELAVELATGAIEKPHITIGDPAAKGLLRMHELAGHPARGTTESMMSHSTAKRSSLDLVRFVRSVYRCGSIYERLGENAKAKNCFRTGTEVCNALLTKAEAKIRYEGIIHYLHTLGYGWLLALEKTDPQDVTEESAAGKAYVAKQAFDAAAKEFGSKNGQVGNKHWKAALAWEISESFLLASLIAIVPFGIVAVFAGRRSAFKLNWWLTAEFALGLLLSFFFWASAQPVIFPKRPKTGSQT